MPWDVTSQYIRSGHRSASDTCRTITLSTAQGIKAIYCKYGEKWAITSYLFSKAKGWTLTKAKSWFSSHNEHLCESLNTSGFHYDFGRIFDTFIKQFGEEEGKLKFKYFLSSNKLDPTKKYHPSVQFSESLYESFNWVKPLIRYLKQDDYAKYYAITCITANISMNNRPYPAEDLKAAAASMNYRPVNLNHNHAKWVNYPRTRMEWAKFENNALEGILRVDNRDKWLQTKLDNHEILHPSIECRPIPPEIGGGLHFTALALLEAGKQLPGDPLTGIEPIVLNESVQDSLTKINGELELNVEQARTDAQRAMAHFNIPPDEWAKLSDKQKQDYISKLPPRGSANQEAFGDASYPDSCFAYVPDAAKGPNGKKSLRKLPYKNKDGTPDLPHVRNALARLNQTQGIPVDKKAQIKTMLQNILKKDNPSYKPEQILNVETQDIDSSENRMPEETPETTVENGEQTREEKLKIAELETTNKLLQEEIDEVTGRFEAYKKETRQKITKLESENAELKVKVTVVEGLKGRVGEKETALLKAEESINKLNEKIRDQKTESDTLKELLGNKGALIDDLRADIKDLKSQLATAKAARQKAEVKEQKMAIDLKIANRECAEAKSSANEASEKYTDIFNKYNEQIQKTGAITRKYNTISEELKILREQATKDGEMIESMKRNTKIMQKKMSRYEKERNERMAEKGEIEVADPTKVTAEELKKAGFTVK